MNQTVSYVLYFLTQDVSEIHNMTLGECSVHKSTEKCLCKHGSMDVSFSSCGLQDRQF